MTADHAMYTPEFFADPHPAYAQLREQAPVQRLRNPNGLEYWLVTRYDEARAAFADGRLSKDPRRAWDALRAAGVVSGEPGEATFDLHTTDPPEHTRLRGLMGRAFTSRRVAGLRERTQQIADELLDAIAERQTADLIEDYAYPLSLTVIAELLGVPSIDHGRFRTWTIAAMHPPFVTDAPMSREEGRRLLREYVVELVAQKRAQARTGGQDDLLTALLAAGDDGDQLTAAELVALTQQLLFAGHEPTTNLIGNGMAALLRHPDQLATLRERPELLPAAIEELLRYDGPTARSSPSYAVDDFTIGDTVVPAGSIVIVGIAAANRDPRRFAEPDRLDITRGDDDRHLAFGHGLHRCLGAALARMEGSVAIGTLLDRFPHLSLACAPEELSWLPFPVFRGLATLPVRVG
ncbi:cytochrome P450 family protein [Plantactinospora veratri]